MALVGSMTPLAPICQICSEHSAAWVVTEQLEDRRCTRLLCAACLSGRALLWERFVLKAKVRRID